jgi:uncharacterized protein (TIGR00730 family)
MYPIRTVTVYCSSSSQLADNFNAAAAELGRAIASNNWKLVYGGNAVGNMGALANGCRAAGGQVIGVTPKLFCEKGVHDQECCELIVTDGMRDRKAIMEERGDAFIALPGGLGTFEEIFEILCGKQLEYHDKPIVLLNIDGYYDPLLAMIAHGVELKFIRPRARELYFVASSVPEAMDYLHRYSPPARAARSFESTPICAPDPTSVE